MQPIGLLVWIYQGQFKKEKQEFVARKLDAKDGQSIYRLVCFGGWCFGLIYQSVGANRPYRDSITDANKWCRANPDDGCLSVNSGFSGQRPIFFSIYLWWGESLQIQGKYLILFNQQFGRMVPVE